LRRLVRAAGRRALTEKNWAWFVIVACAFLLRRALNDKGAVVSSIKISPGEQVLISVRDRSTPAGVVTVGAGGAGGGPGSGAADAIATDES
jgi:hypothetical protein